MRERVKKTETDRCGRGASDLWGHGLPPALVQMKNKERGRRRVSGSISAARKDTGTGFRGRPSEAVAPAVTINCCRSSLTAYRKRTAHGAGDGTEKSCEMEPPEIPYMTLWPACRMITGVQCIYSIMNNILSGRFQKSWMFRNQR